MIVEAGQDAVSSVADVVAGIEGAQVGAQAVLSGSRVPGGNALPALADRIGTSNALPHGERGMRRRPRGPLSQILRKGGTIQRKARCVWFANNRTIGQRHA